MSLRKRSAEFSPDTAFSTSQAELCERGVAAPAVNRALAHIIALHPAPDEMFHKPAEELSSPLMYALLKEYIKVSIPANKRSKLQIVAKPS